MRMTSDPHLGLITHHSAWGHGKYAYVICALFCHLLFPLVLFLLFPLVLFLQLFLIIALALVPDLAIALAVVLDYCSCS